MRSARQLRETQLSELVETHNLALALRRLECGSPLDTERWKRALYHAVCMNYTGSGIFRQKLREALELP